MYVCVCVAEEEEEEEEEEVRDCCGEQAAIGQF
jgi:hypothetical protein